MQSYVSSVQLVIDHASSLNHVVKFIQGHESLLAWLLVSATEGHVQELKQIDKGFVYVVT